MSFSESQLCIHVGSQLFFERVDTTNVLGVTVITNSSWSKNIKHISSKANSLIGMVRRSISFDAPSPVKIQLYVSHIRCICSILEYC